MPTKILVPTDFSEHSDKALRQAFDIARQYKAKVYVVHVLYNKHPYDSSDIATRYEDMKKLTTDYAVKQLQKQIDKFPRSKELEVFSEVVKGNIAEAILEEENSKGIDLIVIASLGQSGMAKYLIGSVARNVLRWAKCPVLLTK